MIFMFGNDRHHFSYEWNSQRNWVSDWGVMKLYMVYGVVFKKLLIIILVPIRQPYKLRNCQFLFKNDV